MRHLYSLGRVRRRFGKFDMESNTEFWDKRFKFGLLDINLLLIYLYWILNIQYNFKIMAKYCHFAFCVMINFYE